MFRNPIGALSDLIADTITGAVINGATIIGGTITGAVLQTAAAGSRWVMDGVSRNRLYGYSADSQETSPGYMEIDSIISGVIGALTLKSPSFGGSNQAVVQLSGNKVDGTSRAVIDADAIVFGSGGGVTIDVTGNKLDFSGDSISKIRGGQTTVTITAAQSSATSAFLHGQGTVPDLVLATVTNGTIGYYATVNAKTSSSISIRATQRDGTVGAATVDVDWLAIWF